jgi:hypothetical protein
MNKYILSIAILLLTLTSCKKEEPVKEKDIYDYYDGQLTIKRNGKDWKFKLLAVTNDTIFGLHIIDLRDGFEWDRATIGSVPPREGSYILEGWKFSPDTLAADVSTAYYNGSFNQGSDIWGPNYLRMDRPHFIRVSSYDSVNHKVSGTFSMSFIRDSSRSKLGVYLDTVSYTDASFSATIWHVDELPK